MSDLVCRHCGKSDMLFLDSTKQYDDAIDEEGNYYLCLCEESVWADVGFYPVSNDYEEIERSTIAPELVAWQTIKKVVGTVYFEDGQIRQGVFLLVDGGER